MGIALTVGSVEVGGRVAAEVVDELGATNIAIASSADVGPGGAVGVSGTFGGHFTGVVFLAGVVVGGGELCEPGPAGRGFTGTGVAVIAFAAAAVPGEVSFANVGPGGAALLAFLETAPVAVPGEGATGAGEPAAVALLPARPAQRP